MSQENFLNMLYGAIFTRLSIRQYEKEDKLPKSKLDEFLQIINNAPKLKGTNARYELLESQDVTDEKAPHYLIANCKLTTNNLINVGFSLQHMDLWFQAQKIGAVWIAIGVPKNKSDDHAIMLAFGKTKLNFRDNISQFNRLKTDEIIRSGNIDGLEKVVEAIRIAPSARNSQPWELDIEKNAITINYHPRGEWAQQLKDKQSKIDIGIAACHAHIALDFIGKHPKEIILPEENSDKVFAKLVF